VLAVHAAEIIHRDLKPSNVLLVEHEKDVRVGDFGLCYIDLEEDKERATAIREKVGPLFSLLQNKRVFLLTSPRDQIFTRWGVSYIS
jgi:serine/threonine protein kinase